MKKETTADQFEVKTTQIQFVCFMLFCKNISHDYIEILKKYFISIKT